MHPKRFRIKAQMIPLQLVLAAEGTGLRSTSHWLILRTSRFDFYLQPTSRGTRLWGRTGARDQTTFPPNLMLRTDADSPKLHTYEHKAPLSNPQGNNLTIPTITWLCSSPLCGDAIILDASHMGGLFLGAASPCGIPMPYDSSGEQSHKGRNPETSFLTTQEETARQRAKAQTLLANIRKLEMEPLARVHRLWP